MYIYISLHSVSCRSIRSRRINKVCLATSSAFYLPLILLPAYFKAPLNQQREPRDSAVHICVYRSFTLERIPRPRKKQYIYDSIIENYNNQ